MLTDRELEGVQTLLDSDSTPNNIKQVLRFTVHCQDTSATTARLEYLESITKYILGAPKDSLEVISYMPQACPRVPALISTEDLSTNPPPEVKEDLYKTAIDSGLHLLTPIEASAMLQGIHIGLRYQGTERYEEYKDKIGYVIHMIAIGQRIREQHTP